MKNIYKKTLTCLLAAGIITSTTSITAFAQDTNSSITEETSYSQKDEKLINAPAKYEYTTQTKALNKNQLIQLKQLADKANKSKTRADFVSTASYVLGLLGLPSGHSMLLSTVGTMIQSDLDAYGTVSYAFDQYVYLTNNPKVTTVNTKFKLKRFFDGFQMKSWYMYGKPTKA